MQMQEHEATSAMQDIDSVAPLSEADAACVEEVTQVLKRHGRLRRFGLTLLHQHFPVAAEEILVEECDPERRTLTIKPQPMASLETMQYRETSWRLDTGKAVMNCVCRVDPDTGSHNHYHVK